MIITIQMDKEIIKIVVKGEDAGQRVDRFCTDHFEGLSRERVKQLIANTGIRIKNVPSFKPSTLIEEGWVISCQIPEAEDDDPEPENIPLDILYEDADVIVINKAVGMVVHPAAGNWTGTLVNALLYHCGDTLSGIGGVKRPGIVHRLDKDTSGVMMVAKNDHAHAHLSAQLADRTLSRIYHALVWDVPVPPVGKIDIAIGRDHKNRLKQAVKRGDANVSRHAVTHYKTLQSFDDAYSLVECRLETVRTHQIRVHMQAKGYALIGDPLYGAQKTFQISRAMRLDNENLKQALLNFPRQALHAHQISFIHPMSEDKMTFNAPMLDDMEFLI
jgi:23S rRNA pseudouridine1911/1915/1917 synthase